jgi:hypothetical protein
MVEQPAVNRFVVGSSPTRGALINRSQFVASALNPLHVKGFFVGPATPVKVWSLAIAGYVWAFTNLEEVVYVYTPTREGTILKDMLDGFTGVLVSDFYAAYDAHKCPQQKCLIHLMRDVNDDLFHNPFDEELKQLAQKLVGVLKPIIDTIDKFGLTQRHLHKHKADLDRLFRFLSAQVYQSEAARKYQKRLHKYRDKLLGWATPDPWWPIASNVIISVSPDFPGDLTKKDQGCLPWSQVGATGLEPVTPSVSSWCSSQLS